MYTSLRYLCINRLFTGYHLILALSVLPRRFAYFSKVEGFAGGSVALLRSLLRSQPNFVLQRPILSVSISLPILMFHFVLSILLITGRGGLLRYGAHGYG